jgi:hypothetical protein
MQRTHQFSRKDLVLASPVFLPNVVPINMDVFWLWRIVVVVDKGASC